MTKINVVDSIMGSGKTTATFNHIKGLPESQPFLFVTPYISEINRIKKQCSEKDIHEPTYKEGRKLYSLRDLLKEKKNIATTHALFELMEEKDVSLIKKHGYVCFIDETLPCINPYDLNDPEINLNKTDVEALINTYVDIDDNTGKLSWAVSNYEAGRFMKEKNHIVNGRLAYFENTLFEILPVSILLAFKEIYILTYLFEGSIMASYLKYNGIDYTYMYIAGNGLDDLHFTTDKKQSVKNRKNFKALINIYEGNKRSDLNKIGFEKYALSVNWYKKAAVDGNNDLDILRNNMLNYLRHIMNAKSKRCLCATFSDYKEIFIKDKVTNKKRYANCFVAINMRASNEYSDKDVVAYLVNRFMHVKIGHYFTTKGVEPDSDLFALSEMLQFIWRSAIRNNKPINIYVPSSRMRNLLTKWIDENSVGE